MSYAVRGKNRTFQVLFVRAVTGDPVDLTNPIVDIFHYDDLDGPTGQNKIMDVVAASLVSDVPVGQYHYVWLVPITKQLRQVHYARYSGTDPLNSKTISCEESFSIIDDTPPFTPSGGIMTSSFIQ